MSWCGNGLWKRSNKYLSRLRINGIPIPANILLISLNTKMAYKYSSNDFLEYIEKLYIGASSTNNQNFTTPIEPETIVYSGDIGKARLIAVLREDNYTKININEDCILGWARKYYTENPTAKKGDFLGTEDHNLFPNDGEIRNPSTFRNFINPYIAKDNENGLYCILLNYLA